MYARKYSRDVLCYLLGYVRGGEEAFYRVPMPFVVTSFNRRIRLLTDAVYSVKLIDEPLKKNQHGIVRQGCTVSLPRRSLLSYLNSAVHVQRPVFDRRRVEQNRFHFHSFIWVYVEVCAVQHWRPDENRYRRTWYVRSQNPTTTEQRVSCGSCEILPILSSLLWHINAGGHQLGKSHDCCWRSDGVFP